MNINILIFFRKMNSILQGENHFVVECFKKYENNPGFSNYLEEFKNLTEIRHKGDILLPDHIIESLAIDNESEDVPMLDHILPNIGPSDELEHFPSTLKEWPDEDKKELKILIKIFDGGEIEDWAEAVIMIEIIKKIEINYPEILDTILEDIMNNTLHDCEKYSNLLNFPKDQTTSFIYSSLWTFLISSVYD